MIELRCPVTRSRISSGLTGGGSFSVEGLTMHCTSCGGAHVYDFEANGSDDVVIEARPEGTAERAVD